jgi:hypothetical protein
MSTASEREAALRRALHSAAEYIEPAPGGLERIQERLRRPRPVLVAQLEAAWTVVVMRAPDVIEAVRRRTANVLRLVWDRFGPKTAGQGPLRWLRPLAAISVAVFVVGAGAYIGLASPPFITGGVPTGVAGDAATHPGGRAGSGAGTQLGSGSPSFYPTAPSSSGSTPACNKSSGPLPQYSAPGSSTSPPSQTTTPAPSTSPITSPPPSSSPTDSTTPTPSTSSTPSAGSGGGLTSGNPVSAGATTGTGANGGSSTNNMAHGTGGVSGLQSASPPSALTRKLRPSSSSQKLNRCHSPKPTSTPSTKASSSSTATQTSAKRTKGQPGKAAEAKLD